MRREDNASDEGGTAAAAALKGVISAKQALSTMRGVPPFAPLTSESEATGTEGEEEEKVAPTAKSTPLKKQVVSPAKVPTPSPMKVDAEEEDDDDESNDGDRSLGNGVGGDGGDGASGKKKRKRRKKKSKGAKTEGEQQPLLNL